MTRVKTGTTRRQRHKKRLSQTKGYRGLRSKIFTQANIAWMKAGLNAYRGRRLKKREYRALWISRISAGLKQINSQFKYSRMIHAMSEKKIGLNRKMIADMALNHPEAFKKLVAEVM